jgi:uncharacterized protein YoxC
MGSKAWDLMNHVLTIATIILVTFLIWRTLTRVKEIVERNASAIQEVNATLESIRERMGNEELWQQVKPLVKQKLENAIGSELSR